MIFIYFIFQTSKIRVSPTDIVSSIFPPRCCFSSDRCHHADASCHLLLMEPRRVRCLRFIFWQCFVQSISLSSRNWSIEFALSPLAILPRPPTHILHCYKNIISTLVTLSTTQSRLYFTSSLARAPHHRSSIHRHHSLSLLSHVHHSFTQRHPRWWTSWSYFTS
jgi:hypothetical protein